MSTQAHLTMDLLYKLLNWHGGGQGTAGGAVLGSQESTAGEIEIGRLIWLFAISVILSRLCHFTKSQAPGLENRDYNSGLFIGEISLSLLCWWVASYFRTPGMPFM